MTLTQPPTPTPQQFIPPHPLTPEFNLIEEPWIPVTMHTGEHTTYSLKDIFINGNTITDLDTNDFLEYAAIHRLLTSLTYLAVGLYGQNTDWETIINTNENFPTEVTNQLLQRIENHFWLYHPDTPFLQNNHTREHFTVTVKSKTPVLEDFTHSIYTCYPSSPQSRTQTWFTGSRGEYPPTINQATAARFLTTRHFCALAGNEQDFKLPTMSKPNRRSPGTVILPSYAQATYLIRKSTNLINTLLVNLHETILNTITPTTTFFWEDPHNPTTHLDDKLYLYTATGTGTYIPYQGNTISRVIRTGLPVADKETSATLIGLARIHDPHVIRFTKENTPAQKPGDVVTAYFNPSAHSYQQIWETYNKTFEPKSTLTERPHLLKPKGAGPIYGKPATTTTLAISMNTKVGSPPGPKVQEAIGGTITPDLFLLPAEKRKQLIMLLANIVGVKQSIVSYLAYAMKNVYSANKADRTPIEPVLWAHITPHITTPKERVLHTSHDETVTASLTDEEKNNWIQAGMDTYATLTANLLNNPRTTAKVLEQKNLLHYNLRRVIFNV